MIDKQSQSSLMDLLLRIMPDLKDRLSKEKVNNKAANTLYTIWKNEAAKVATNKFRRPVETAFGDVKMLETEGLVNCTGEELTITAKGGGVLKQMILGDNSSAFNEKPHDYLTSLANLKPSRRKRMKCASSEEKQMGRNWYTDMKYGI